ncbi:flagellar biosynthetic protein FliO [candidate division KSB1 bacterium]
MDIVKRPKSFIVILLCSVLFNVMPAALSASDRQIAVQDTTEAVTDSAAVAGSRDVEIMKFGQEGAINMMEIVGKMVGYFLLIVLLIFGLVYFLKRFVYNRKELLGKNSAIRVITSSYVAPKKSLMLVEVLDRLLVLSVTDNNMSLISELSKEEYNVFKKGDTDHKTAESALPGQFGDMLSRLIKREK